MWKKVECVFCGREYSVATASGFEEDKYVCYNCADFEKNRAKASSNSPI